MNTQLARLALRLYPLAYRRRYGAEIEALLEDSGSSPRVVADLLRGALSAHLRPASVVAGEVSADERVRLGVGSVLLCWVLFAATGFGFYKTTEGAGFAFAGESNGLIAGAHLAIQILAVVATAAVVIGAAPLVFAALRQAGKRPRARRAALFAVGCVAAFAAATAGLVAVANAKPAVSAGVAAATFGTWGALGLACGVGCVLAARRGLAVVEVSPRLLRGAMLAAVVVTLTMVALTAATAVFLVALLAAAPGLAGQGNGPLGLTSVAVSVGLQLGAFALIAAIAALGVRRTRVAEVA